jgi:hypothetical protein
MIVAVGDDEPTNSTACVIAKNRDDVGEEVLEPRVGGF